MKTKTKTEPYHLELYFKRPLYTKMTHLSSCEDTNKFIREIIDVGLINHKEFFWMIVLGHSNRVLGFKEVSSGKTHSTTVCFKEIAQTVLLSNATRCILVHNHPSGNLTPSASDIAKTQKAKMTLKLIDVELLDHLIITQEDYKSISNNNY